jgi:hypothetical protein
MAPDGGLASEEAPSLDRLRRRVHTARDEVLSLRRGPGNSTPLLCARHFLRVAMGDYVSTLHTLQLPIPPALRQELLLYQRLEY